MQINLNTKTFLKLLTLLLLVSGCSFKIPPGTYTTSPPPSSGNFAFAGESLTLTENGRFQYLHWSDDSFPTKGLGGYIIFSNNILLLFENVNIPKSVYSINEITCTEQDSQIVNFKIIEKSGAPLVGVGIINNENQGTISQLDGTAHIVLLKNSKNRVFLLHYMGFEDIEINVDGDKCFDIDIAVKEKMTQLQRWHMLLGKLKREGDQLYIKLPFWKGYQKIYLKEN